MKQVRDQLLESAGQFGRSALEAFLASEWRKSMQDAGTTLEHVAKAHLASSHPSLIVDGRSFDALLHAAGLPHARVPLDRVRTISAREAVTRCTQIMPSLAVLEKDLTLLIDVRNGVVHLGGQAEQASRDTLIPFLKACEALLSDIGEPSERVWGPYADMVKTRISDSAKEAEIRVADAMAAAKVLYESRFSDVEKSVRPAVIKAIEAGYTPQTYDEQLVDCPACSSAAFVSGSTDVQWEPDYEFDGIEAYVSGVSPLVTFYAGQLECRVCGLELDGEDELSAAGIEESWELENIDPADFADYDED